MNSMKRQKVRTPNDDLPKSAGAQYVTGEEWRIIPERVKRWSQSKGNTQLWVCLVVKVKDVVKNSIA